MKTKPVTRQTHPRLKQLDDEMLNGEKEYEHLTIRSTAKQVRLRVCIMRTRFHRPLFRATAQIGNRVHVADAAVPSMALEKLFQSATYGLRQLAVNDPTLLTKIQAASIVA